MTGRTNARIAGVTLLLYIAVGVAAMAISSSASRGTGAARLTQMTQNVDDVRASALLGFSTSFVALALGVALYGLTRHEDHDLAMLGLSCRVAEGVIGAVSIVMTFGLLSVLLNKPDAATDPGVQTLASFVFAARRTVTMVAATFFAVGSTLFAVLFVRAKMLPVALGSLGVISSLLLVVGQPLELATVISGSLARGMWIPMAIFEVWLAVWLLWKGVAARSRSYPAAATAEDAAV